MAGAASKKKEKWQPLQSHHLGSVGDLPLTLHLHVYLGQWLPKGTLSKDILKLRKEESYIF